MNHSMEQHIQDLLYENLLGNSNPRNIREQVWAIDSIHNGFSKELFY